jgi:hypothetical protein
MLEYVLGIVLLISAATSSSLDWLKLSAESEASYINSVSSRISKGQGYRGFVRKRAGSSFGKKKGNLRRTIQGKNTKKNGQNSLLLGSIKCFP